MKVFYIDCALGSAICSIPSLIKYQQNHLNDEWYVIMRQPDITFGIKELQNKTFYPDSPGIWEHIFLRTDDLVTIKPYFNPNYYKQRINIAESYDELINKTTNHNDLNYATLKISPEERDSGRETINAIKNGSNKKTVIIQPFGSTCIKTYNSLSVFDHTYRSFSKKLFLKILNKLSKKYNFIYFGHTELIDETFEKNFFMFDKELTHREWFSIFSQSDYFVGCDSSGKHIFRSLNLPGTVIFGSGIPAQASYPNHFHIIKKETETYFIPYDIYMDYGFDRLNRLNEESINFTDSEINNICDAIEFEIESKT